MFGKPKPVKFTPTQRNQRYDMDPDYGITPAGTVKMLPAEALSMYRDWLRAIERIEPLVRRGVEIWLSKQPWHVRLAWRLRKWEDPSIVRVEFYKDDLRSMIKELEEKMAVRRPVLEAVNMDENLIKGYRGWIEWERELFTKVSSPYR